MFFVFPWTVREIKHTAQEAVIAIFETQTEIFGKTPTVSDFGDPKRLGIRSCKIYLTVNYPESLTGLPRIYEAKVKLTKKLGGRWVATNATLARMDGFVCSFTTTKEGLFAIRSAKFSQEALESFYKQSLSPRRTL